MSDNPPPISAMPCPFCGSTYAHKIEAKFGKPPHVSIGYRLQCCLCDAQTGVGMTDEIIKGYWERRVQLDGVGRKVEKIGGDYQFAGTVVAEFWKLSGVTRYVVEDDRGVLHIFSEKNLVVRT